ncbi:MAG: hypothetical protein NVSMB51_16460 [Solirubrobacteraceae bacterium]
MVELRSGPLRSALAAALPVLEEIGRALDGREVVIVPGNHDHALLAPWLDVEEQPLALERRLMPDFSAAAQQLAAALGNLRFAYPGIWVRDDVWASHGHYLDAHVTVPSFERLGVGAMRRLASAGEPRRAEDYEALLAPMYAWIHASAQRGGGRANSGGGARAWRALNGSGRRSLRSRAIGAAFPLAIAGLNRAGLGPLRSELSPVAIREAALAAMRDVLRCLGVEAAHAIFGHTHRTGPLSGEPAWTTPGAPQLHNTGSWVFETHFMARAEPGNPYWPGGGVLVEPGAAPRGLRLLDDVAHAELASKQTA